LSAQLRLVQLLICRGGVFVAVFVIVESVAAASVAFAFFVILKM
jgi:hypothetical protein